MDVRPRPIIRVDDATTVSGYLQQKQRGSTKNYRNRLSRLGDLRFERVRSSADLALIIDDLIAFYDLRQGATNDVVPFQGDSLKKGFHLALSRHHDLLHVSLLRAGSELISALVGVADGRTFSLGMAMFSPFRASYSPVTVHLLMLVELLHQEGFQALDLTPGDDAFKQRFASDHDQVRTLTIYFRPSSWLRHRAFQRSQRLLVSGASTLRLPLRDVRASLSKLARVGPTGLLASVKGRIAGITSRFWSTAETRVYALSVAEAGALGAEARMQRDRAASLLAFQPRFGWQTRQRFLSDSLKKIERGHHLYSEVTDGVLVHYGWLIEQQDRNFFAEAEQAFRFVPGTAMLYDFYTDPMARGRGLYQRSLKQMAKDAAERPGTQQVLISVLAGNGPSRHVIEKVGFRYVGSLFLTTRAGRKTRRSTVPATDGSPETSPEAQSPA